MYSEEKTVGQIITEAIELHELKIHTVEKELKWSAGVLKRVMDDNFYTNSVPIVLFKNLLLSLHIPFKKIEAAMLPTFRLLISKETIESIRHKSPHYKLWENEESLNKYTKRLGELMGESTPPTSQKGIEERAEAYATTQYSKHMNYFHWQIAYSGYLAAALSDRWLPIETAPKDGTEIIMRNKENAKLCKWKNNFLSWFYSDIDIFSHPLGWMPLPAPPKDNK